MLLCFAREQVKEGSLCNLVSNDNVFVVNNLA